LAYCRRLEYSIISDRLGDPQATPHPRWNSPRLGVGNCDLGDVRLARVSDCYGLFPSRFCGYPGMAQKEAAGIAEKRSGARGPENVWGSALTGTLCAVGVLFLDEPYRSFLLLGFVASFATKLSDTTASEVGKAYGKRTFLITTLQPVSPGTEGAVSLEGTLAGAVASAAIAVLGWGVGFIGLTGVYFCVLAAFIATNLESVIGATWQSQVEWMTNEVVNFINTLIGAIAAILFIVIWHSIALG